MKVLRISTVVAIFAIVSIFSGACNLLLDPIANLIAPALTSDRPPGILCNPSHSDSTLDSGELTYRTDHLMCITIEMDGQQWDVMRKESRFGPSIDHDEGKTVVKVVLDYLWNCDVPFPSEFNWYEAKVTVDGMSLEGCGVRKKGFLGSIFSSSPSILVQTERFNSGQRFGTTSRLTLNNGAEDRTRVMQCLNYRMFAWADYPAPRCNLANVSVNAEPLGPYSHLESVDAKFLQREFGNSTGHLYEGQLVDFVAKWHLRWDAKTNNTDPDAAPLKPIADVLANSSDANLKADLEAVLNIDNFMTFWALEAVMAHWDGYSGNRNNFYVYLDPADGGRATFIPWGMNYFAGEVHQTSLRRHVSSEIPRRLSRLPEMRSRFNTEVQRILDDVYDESQMISFVDSLADQVRLTQADDEYTEHIDELKKWINGRRSVVEELLVGGLPSGDSIGGKCLFNNNDDLEN